jgi:hypothetical protein
MRIFYSNSELSILMENNQITEELSITGKNFLL